MPSNPRGHLVRRALITAGAVATVGGGVGAVRVAQILTAAAVQVDTAPAPLTTLQGGIDQQAGRAQYLGPDAASLDQQVRNLVSAVSSGAAAADAQSATAAQVAADVAAAKARLTRLQGQLAAASNRLAALDAAGARLAGSGSRTVTATTGASGAAAGHDD